MNNYSQNYIKSIQTENIKISVIVPCYNEEKNISACLSSIIKQTYQNLEIIIVYKESNDNTLKLIEEFDDIRIKLIYQQENNGIGGARNIGIKEASGDYIAFVECTELDLDYFEKLLNAILKDDSDIIMCPIANIDRLKYFNIKKYKPFCAISLLDKYAYYNCGAMFAKLIKTELIKNNNILCPENMIYEDNPFLIKCFYYAKKIAGTVDCLYKYSPTGIGNKNKDKILDDLLLIVQDIMGFITDKNFSRKEKDLLKKKMFRSFLDVYITESGFYNKIVKIMGFNSYIYSQYLRRKIKKKIKEIFNIKGRKNE